MSILFLRGIGFDSRVSISLPIRVVIVNCGLLCELVALLN